MSEPIDIAVDLGVIPPPLPDEVSLRQMVEAGAPPPRQIIEGILHQGCKMILGGTSKSNKTWALLDLAISSASGQKWWGRQCTRGRVLYINFELPTWALLERLNALCTARPECSGIADNLFFLNLRGFAADMSLLRPKLPDQLALGGDDTADALRYLVATKGRTVTQRKLRGT
jgi:hypothetical protein